MHSWSMFSSQIRAFSADHNNSLLQKIVHDLRMTLSPVYPDLLNHLLKLLARSISASALTVLLSTFSSLFKYLLVPSIEANLLEQTWSCIHNILPRCAPEVQRAMAEVWALVLRRLNPTARKQAVGLVAADLTGIEDPCAWMFIYACQVQIVFFDIYSQTYQATCTVLVADIAYCDEVYPLFPVIVSSVVRGTHCNIHSHPPRLNGCHPPCQFCGPI
jgi:U3 small nucleolar RNA-associated protein 20